MGIPWTFFSTPGLLRLFCSSYEIMVEWREMPLSKNLGNMGKGNEKFEEMQNVVFYVLCTLAP